jgi:hypothetical protein
MPVKFHPEHALNCGTEVGPALEASLVEKCALIERASGKSAWVSVFVGACQMATFGDFWNHVHSLIAGKAN